MGEATEKISPELEIEGFVFPAEVSIPGFSEPLFLGGAGVRGLEIGDKFIKFTAIGVYLGNGVVASLAGKRRGKSGDELSNSVEFFRDVITGPFEKLTQVTMILPLTGQQYSEKVAENCISSWKEAGVYTEAEAKAVEKFKEIFHHETFPHAASIIFSHSFSGSVSIGFSKDGSIPKTWNAVIENKRLSEAILESIIGEHGVSPAAKKSLAFRLSKLLSEYN
uniref:Chalcone-flavonone isomerase family protein n=1 Tax=Dioscorea alata TaxID=55571 RepID=A0A386PXP5_DIOAL|nr:chalcone isomerase [Dioscorea alata]